MPEQTKTPYHRLFVALEEVEAHFRTQRYEVGAHVTLNRGRRLGFDPATGLYTAAEAGVTQRRYRKDWPQQEAVAAAHRMPQLEAQLEAQRAAGTEPIEEAVVSLQEFLAGRRA